MDQEVKWKIIGIVLIWFISMASVVTVLLFDKDTSNNKPCVESKK